MTDPINLMVTEVRIDTLDVTKFGGPTEVVRGRCEVTLQPTDQHHDTISVDWTHRGDPPTVGTRFVLLEAP